MNNTEAIKKNSEFIKLYKSGKFYIGKMMVVYVLFNNKGKNRIGISTVKNFGSSVLRNRMRRLVKENYRLMEDDIKTGWDIVFSIKKIKETVPVYDDVEREMRVLLKKARLLEIESQQDS